MFKNIKPDFGSAGPVRQIWVSILSGRALQYTISQPGLCPQDYYLPSGFWDFPTALVGLELGLEGHFLLYFSLLLWEHFSPTRPVKSNEKECCKMIGEINILIVFRNGNFLLKWVHPIIFASNVFHNSHLIQKCIQNQQQLLNQMRVVKNIRHKDDRMNSL